jgi:RNA polymerase sigma-70 factor (ECF subfamily)
MFQQPDLVKEMPKLHRFANRLCRNRDEAEDLLQATLLRALEKKDQFDEGTNLFGWTSKIMYNQFVSTYRRRVKFESQYDPEDYISRQYVEPSQETEMQLKRVKEAMQELSDEHRTILIMICVNGIKYQQAAKILELPVGTVRSRLSRARERLSEILGESAGETQEPVSGKHPVPLPRSGMERRIAA